MRRGDGQDATGNTGSRGIGEVTAGPTALPSLSFPGRLPPRSSPAQSKDTADLRSAWSGGERRRRLPAIASPPARVRPAASALSDAPPAAHLQPPAPPLCDPPGSSRAGQPGRREPGGALHSALSKENATCGSNARRRGPEAARRRPQRAGLPCEYPRGTKEGSSCRNQAARAGRRIATGIRFSEYFP